ncbi:Uncharacterised protein [Actinobaculum suis]|uniref:Uncharacterized protein n=1 Tax=Actinobaculum suis TaxID=1657 RepID=A0A7Z8Y9D6_9ACTO|nr:hypothetical protein [Actinobaculum suis]VDG76653.1 Uncharacterised protein [Actinobaculum suis]
MAEDGEIIKDDRRRATGWPRFLLLALLVAAVVFCWRGVVSATSSAIDGNGLDVFTTILAALCWLGGAIGCLHNGRKMRWVATVCWIINIALPFFGVGFPDAFVPVNPWYRGGETYFYLPTLGAILALAWLLWSRPSNLQKMREAA